MSAIAGPTLFYFAERHPRLDRAGFVARWRQHGALGMAMPRWRNIRRYAQCDGLPLPGMADCDGIAVVTYKSEAHRLAHIADSAASRTMKADELETFARPVRSFAVLTEPETRRPPQGTAEILLFGRVSRNPALTPEAFREQWRRRFGEPLAAAGLDQGYCQAFARHDGEAPLWDAVEAIRTSDPAASAAAIRQLAAEARDLATLTLSAGRETLLWQDAG